MSHDFVFRKTGSKFPGCCLMLFGPLMRVSGRLRLFRAGSSMYGRSPFAWVFVSRCLQVGCGHVLALGCDRWPLALINQRINSQSRQRAKKWRL